MASERERVDVEALAIELESTLKLIAGAIEQGTVATMVDVLSRTCSGQWARRVRALGSERDAAIKRAEEAEAKVAELQAHIRKWPSLECPCCGEEAAWASFFEDGQPTECGCGGIVSADGEGAFIGLDECVNPKCLADEDLRRAGKLPAPTADPDPDPER